MLNLETQAAMISLVKWKNIAGQLVTRSLSLRRFELFDYKPYRTRINPICVDEVSEKVIQELSNPREQSVVID